MDDLFRIPAKKASEYKEFVTKFHFELLQLDSNRNAVNIHQLQEQITVTTKFPWRMMCLKLSEVNLLIKFFQEYICPINKAAFNCIDKIDLWNDEGGILEEEPFHDDYKKYIQKENAYLKEQGCKCACECGARRNDYR